MFMPTPKLIIPISPISSKSSFTSSVCLLARRNSRVSSMSLNINWTTLSVPPTPFTSNLTLRNVHSMCPRSRTLQRKMDLLLWIVCLTEFLTAKHGNLLLFAHVHPTCKFLSTILNLPSLPAILSPCRSSVWVVHIGTSGGHVQVVTTLREKQAQCKICFKTIGLEGFLIFYN